MTFQDPHHQNPFSAPPESGGPGSPRPYPEEPSPPPAPLKRKMGDGTAWGLALVIPLILVLGGYGLLYALFGVDDTDSAADPADAVVASIPTVTATVTETPQTTPSTSTAASEPTTAAPSPEAESPVPTAPAAPAAEQISPGNYEIEMAGGNAVRCQMYDPNLGMLLACQSGNVGWTNDAGQSANSVSIQFGPARARGVVGDLGNFTMEGSLSAGGVYEMSTPEGTILIDTSDPERIVFTKDGEEAWISRSSFGPVTSPLDQLR